jgi:hypothetical protein
MARHLFSCERGKRCFSYKDEYWQRMLSANTRKLPTDCDQAVIVSRIWLHKGASIVSLGCHQVLCQTQRQFWQIQAPMAVPARLLFQALRKILADTYLRLSDSATGTAFI